MGKLVKCSDCNHEVSKSAKACPNCGAKKKKSRILLKLMLGTFGFLFAVGYFSGPSDVKATKPSATQAKAPTAEYDQLFYMKYKTGPNKGTTKVLGYYTTERDEAKLKEHCRKDYRGYTQCYYYDKFKGSSKLVHISALKPLEAMKAAGKTPYFKMVDISVDGNNVRVQPAH